MSVKDYFYDLHIHSCLSPCADNDMSPANIAGMGVINELGIMALTDHNSCGNCPAFFEACRAYGVVPIPGMELTTAEDIHIVCLFERLDLALEFSKLVHERLMPIKNKPEIFGDQLYVDAEGNTLKTEELLLIGATDITLEEAPMLVREYGGVCYPAHIDRESNGIIAILGDIPPEPGFVCAELHDGYREEEFRQTYPVTDTYRFVASSDAHHLWDISMDKNAFSLDTESDSEEEIRRALIRHLSAVAYG